jgi:hypothetical protein
VTGTRREISETDKSISIYDLDKKMGREELTHPATGSKAPAMTAPNETPTVKPVFTRPMKRPRRLLPASSRTMTKDMVKIPAAPAPLTARPRRKTGRVWAKPVITPPMEKRLRGYG